MPLTSKTRRKFVIAVAVLVPAFFIAAAYTVINWRAAAVLKGEIGLARERGEPVWFADLAPANDDEALDRGAQIVSLLAKVSSQSWSAGEATSGDLWPEQKAEVPKLVAMDLPVCRKIAAVATEGDCRFSFDFNTAIPGETPLDHLDALSRVTSVLYLAGQLSLDNGDDAEALERITELFATAELLRTDPFYVSQAVRARLAGYGLDLLQLLLPRGRLSANDISRLDRQLKRMERVYRLRESELANRAAAMTMLENLGRPDMGEFLAALALGNGSQVIPNAQWKNVWWGSPLYRARRLNAQAVVLRLSKRFAELIDQRGPQTAIKLESLYRECCERADPPANVLVANPRVMWAQGLAHRQRLISARWALALCGYRATHGRLPDSLKGLANPPSKQTIGLLSGKPLVYERSDDGFTIYDETPKQGRFEVQFARDAGRP